VLPFFRVVFVPSPLDSRISVTEFTLPLSKPWMTGWPASVAFVVGRFEDSQAAIMTMTMLLISRMPTRLEVMMPLPWLRCRRGVSFGAAP